MNIYIIICLIIIVKIFIIIIYNYKINNYLKNKGSMKDICIYYDKVYIKESNVGGNYGRGVYAREDIKKGEVFEKAEIIEDKEQVLRGIILDYTFNLQSRGRNAMAFNAGSIYNHSDEPNAKYYLDDNKNIIVFYALKDIGKDEEIIVSYGDKWWKIRGKEFKKK